MAGGPMNLILALTVFFGIWAIFIAAVCAVVEGGSRKPTPDLLRDVDSCDEYFKTGRYPDES